MSNLFNPVRGMRDFNAQETTIRNTILKQIQTVTERNGFRNIKTPIVENKVFLNKGNEESENSKLGFNVTTDRSNSSEPTMGLRYDLTVPLARFYSANKASLSLPFRSYQTGEVYRAERPQRGRYREFTQCDIDIIGDKTIVAEIDVLLTAFQVFDLLNINKIKTTINDKQILLRILKKIGFTDSQIPLVVREIDKLDKISLEQMVENLVRTCNQETVKELESFIQTCLLCDNNKQKLELVFTYIENSYLPQIIEFFGDKVTFNPFLARGMDYYTGLIFEVKTLEDSLSIAAGGRYDNFKDTVPAVGLSFGFERLIPLIQKTNNEGNSCLLIYDNRSSLNEIFEAKQQLIDKGFLVTLQPKPNNVSNLLVKYVGVCKYFVMFKPNVNLELKVLE
jgi:histidyl-tRNA synthetase